MTRDCGALLGELRKARMLALHEARHAAELRAARCAFLRLLLERGSASIDELGGFPEKRPLWTGAIPGPLRDLKIIGRDGYRETIREIGHSRPITVWRLVDVVGARAWLTENGSGLTANAPSSETASPIAADEPAEVRAGGSGQITFPF